MKTRGVKTEDVGRDRDGEDGKRRPSRRAFLRIAAGTGAVTVLALPRAGFRRAGLRDPAGSRSPDPRLLTLLRRHGGEFGGARRGG